MQDTTPRRRRPPGPAARSRAAHRPRSRRLSRSSPTARSSASVTGLWPWRRVSLVVARDSRTGRLPLPDRPCPRPATGRPSEQPRRLALPPECALVAPGRGARDDRSRVALPPGVGHLPLVLVAAAGRRVAHVVLGHGEKEVP